jgi:DNA-binding LacI/PurR family transcriptional regulator
VPEDLTVTGFDGVPEAERAGLTTVSAPVLEKGRAAGRLLLDRPPLDRRQPRRRTVTLPSELVVRTSSSVAKGRS